MALAVITAQGPPPLMVGPHTRAPTESVDSLAPTEKFNRLRERHFGLAVCLLVCLYAVFLVAVITNADNPDTLNAKLHLVRKISSAPLSFFVFFYCFVYCAHARVLLMLHVRWGFFHCTQPNQNNNIQGPFLCQQASDRRVFGGDCVENHRFPSLALILIKVGLRRSFSV
jgi:hypothetical protein